jgi:hypothetical protein
VEEQRQAVAVEAIAVGVVEEVEGVVVEDGMWEDGGDAEEEEEEVELQLDGLVESEGNEDESWRGA